MEVVIHGSTGGGAKVFYKTETIPFEVISSIVKDLRRGNNENPIEQFAYSIEFVPNGCAFSRCVIVRDVQRGAIGNIVFSLFIPFNKKLAGENIKRLLDHLAGQYCENFIKEGNLGNRNEDWHLVNELINQEKSYLRVFSLEDTENFIQGTNEAAFIYYFPGEMSRYFDAPFQDEYKDYRQVFFVDINLDNKAENPLNALRHDPVKNLTGQIDLENPKYKLLFDDTSKGGIKIEVRKNGSKRNNKSIVHRKDELEIEWQKIYYKPIIFRKEKNGLCYVYEEGEKLEDGENWNNFLKYFIVNEDSKTISINKIELQPVKKIFFLNTFVLKNGNQFQINDLEITCKNNYSNITKEVIENTITFVAEELKDKWTISAKKDNFTGKEEFVPENQNTNIDLKLEEHKLIEFDVKDENGKNIDFKVLVRKRIEGLFITHNQQIKLVDDAIEKDIEVEISSNGYETKTLPTIYPRSQNDKISVVLKKKEYSSNNSQGNYYYVSAGDHGTFKKGSNNISKYKNGSDVISIIIPNKGYKFSHFDFEEKTNTIKAQYDEKKTIFTKNRIIAGGVVCLLIILFIVISNVNSNKDNQNDKKTNERNITQYVQSIELKSDKLEEYKKEYCQETNVIKPKPKKNVFRTIFPTRLKNKIVATSEISETINLPDFCQKLQVAISIRNALNQGKIDDLRTQNYSDQQKEFKSAVFGIKEEFKNEISQTMRTHNSLFVEMNLIQIAEFINNLQKLLQIKEDVKSLNDVQVLEIKKSDIENIDFPINSIKENIKAEIDKKIATFQQEQLKHQQKVEQQNQQSKIQQNQQAQAMQQEFNRKFLELLQSENITKQMFDDLVGEYDKKNISPQNQYRIFYSKYISLSSEFNKFKNIHRSLDHKDRVTKSLEDFEKLIEKLIEK